MKTKYNKHEIGDSMKCECINRFYCKKYWIYRGSKQCKDLVDSQKNIMFEEIE